MSRRFPSTDDDGTVVRAHGLETAGMVHRQHRIGAHDGDRPRVDEQPRADHLVRQCEPGSRGGGVHRALRFSADLFEVDIATSVCPVAHGMDAHSPKTATRWRGRIVAEAADSTLLPQFFRRSRSCRMCRRLTPVENRLHHRKQVARAGLVAL